MTRKRFYLVTVDRTTVYRVKASCTERAMNTFTDADEVDQTTNDMTVEIDANQAEGGCRQTACRHCGTDIENLAPYRRGEWRDRGNNRHCNNGRRLHAPIPE